MARNRYTMNGCLVAIQTLSIPNSSRISNSFSLSLPNVLLLDGRIRFTTVVSPFFWITSVRIQDELSSISDTPIKSEICLLVACQAILRSENDSMFPLMAFWAKIRGGAIRNAAAAQMNNTMDGGIRKIGSSANGNACSGTNAHEGKKIVTSISAFTSAPPWISPIRHER